MKIRFYKRCGLRVSEAKVLKARDNYAEGKRTGQMGLLKCSIQPEVADSVSKMTAREFASFSGQFSYRVKEK